MPAKLAETLGLTDNVRSIPIVEPAVTHTVGLVVPHREPMTPLIAALVVEGRRLAAELARSNMQTASMPEKPTRREKRATKKADRSI
jgi:hypothetical protein